MDESESAWCEDCGRLKGIGCTCGMTFREKIQGIQVNEASLKYGPRRGKRHKKR
jgi:hypothetical protein